MNLCASSQGSCFRRTVLLYPNPKVRPPKGVCCIKQKEMSLYRLCEDGQTCFMLYSMTCNVMIFHDR